MAYRWLAEDEAYRIVPSPQSCEKIATALSYDVDYILELAGHRKPRPDQPPMSALKRDIQARTARMMEMVEAVEGVPDAYVETYLRKVFDGFEAGLADAIDLVLKFRQRHQAGADGTSPTTAESVEGTAEELPDAPHKGRSRRPQRPMNPREMAFAT